MNYEQFVWDMLECVKSRLPESESVEKQEILKNNGVVAIGLSVRKWEENMAPIIYLEEYYKKYCMGETIEELAGQLLERVYTAPATPAWEYEDILDFGKIKSRVIYKLINTERNQKLLREVPHLPMLDFSIVFYVMIPVNESESCSILIRNSHMNYWKLPISFLYHCAKMNTPRLCPFVLQPLTAFVEEQLGEQVPESPLIVLSNESGLNGAAAILYPEMPRKIFQYLEKNYYILPSSIHEVLIVPENPDVFPEYLQEIVREVNENHIAEEEYLSDSVYYFDGNIITKM